MSRRPVEVCCVAWRLHRAPDGLLAELLGDFAFRPASLSELAGGRQAGSRGGCRVRLHLLLRVGASRHSGCLEGRGGQGRLVHDCGRAASAAGHLWRQVGFIPKLRRFAARLGLVGRAPRESLSQAHSEFSQDLRAAALHPCRPGAGGGGWCAGAGATGTGLGQAGSDQLPANTGNALCGGVRQAVRIQVPRDVWGGLGSSQEQDQDQAGSPTSLRRLSRVHGFEPVLWEHARRHGPYRAHQQAAPGC